MIAPLGLLGNKDAENKIYIPNIIDEPKIEKYDLYFVDIKKKKVLYNEKIYTNQVNEIELKNEFIEPSVFLCTKDYLGIPIFVSQKDSHLSMEHTHPTHENILSNDRFSKTNELKNKINEIIN